MSREVIKVEFKPVVKNQKLNSTVYCLLDKSVSMDGNFNLEGELVAPLKTVDMVVKKIPLVKDILRGSLISVPFRIKGNMENPKVIPLSLEALGSGLLGIMKRTLQLPVKVIQPVLSGEEKN